MICNFVQLCSDILITLCIFAFRIYIPKWKIVHEFTDICKRTNNKTELLFYRSWTPSLWHLVLQTKETKCNLANKKTGGENISSKSNFNFFLFSRRKQDLLSNENTSPKRINYKHGKVKMAF